MEQIYFAHDLDVIYFVYGLSFFIMGYGILTQSKSNSIFKISGIIWLLGVFGVLHGINEWLDMWVVIKGRSQLIDYARWGFLIVSYCFLLDFGLRMCMRNIKPEFNRKYSLDIWLVLVVLLVIAVISLQSDNFLTTSNILSRYFMGLTGSVLTGAGFIIYYHTEDEKIKGATYMKYKFWVLALSFLVYGILCGLIVPKGSFFPASVLNVVWFHSVTNLPVRFIRGIFIAISALNIGNILSTFQRETNYQLQEALAYRKTIEDELIKSQEQLRSFAIRLQSLIEKERTRIARELHDEISQSLTSLKIDIDELLVPDVSGDNSLMISQILDIEKSIDSVIDRMHDIATDLRPSILDQLGLLAAIDWQAKKFTQRTGIKCDVRYNSNITSSLGSFGAESSTALFRIYQEALTNVCRHANANKVTVFMYNNDNGLVVKVVDDGVGIERQKVFDHNSLGLMGMRERVALFGWQMEIKGKTNKGTVVKLLIPEGSIGQ
ncbi:MAG: sensor histidine kinase [Nitrospirae bacterium]|nr:sensor histidine kinase [Nitrospirota bacterium]MBF0533873.1 sensor histidine kinase [Nitrospirota bacterium]MBF0615418.1 sensor histidine kinase [Nitrospirota bacterium]